MVEGGYPAAGQIEGLGPFQEAAWVDSVSFDLAVRFRDGWVALVWSGPLLREDGIRRRLCSFGKDMVELSVGSGPAWPGLIGFVANDKWEEELVYRAVQPWRSLADRVSVWRVPDCAWSGAVHPLDSRHWVRQPADPAGMGGWPWTARTAASPWAAPGPDPVDPDLVLRFGQAGSPLSAGILDFLLERPDTPTQLISHALGENPSSRNVQNRLTVLLRERLVTRRPAGRGRGYRYSLSSKGEDLLVRRDRAASPRKKHREPAGEENGNQRRGSRRVHEDLLTELFAELKRAGIPVATGERSWEHLGDGGLAPDAMALFFHSPYGWTWYYVEIELTAVADDRVEKKLRGYGNPHRQDRFPLLVVCLHDGAEANFHRHGQRLKLQMLTTTVERLRTHGPLGNDACWSRYGWPAPLPAPAK